MKQIFSGDCGRQMIDAIDIEREAEQNVIKMAFVQAADNSRRARGDIAVMLDTVDSQVRHETARDDGTDDVFADPDRERAVAMSNFAAEGGGQPRLVRRKMGKVTCHKWSYCSKNARACHGAAHLQMVGPFGVRCASSRFAEWKGSFRGAPMWRRVTRRTGEPAEREL